MPHSFFKLKCARQSDNSIHYIIILARYNDPTDTARTATVIQANLCAHDSVALVFFRIRKKTFFGLTFVFYLTIDT